MIELDQHGGAGIELLTEGGGFSSVASDCSLGCRQ